MDEEPTVKGPESGVISERDAPPREDQPGTDQAPPLPDYKGAPIDPERGPGLGCFWFQVGLLVLLLVLTPLSVYASAPSWVSAALLIIVLVLLFFVGQTMIFLLRLVAADRRTRRRPMAPSARKTVGEIEDESAAAGAATAAAPENLAAAPASDEEDTAPDEPLT